MEILKLNRWSITKWGCAGGEGYARRAACEGAGGEGWRRAKSPVTSQVRRAAAGMARSGVAPSQPARHPGTQAEGAAALSRRQGAVGPGVVGRGTPIVPTAPPPARRTMDTLHEETVATEQPG